MRGAVHAVLALLAGSGLLPAQQVLVVGPGRDFPTIQDAIDVSADGDVVLVESGTYPVFDVAGLSVTIVAEAGADVEVDSGASTFSTIGGTTASGSSSAASTSPARRSRSTRSS